MAPDTGMYLNLDGMTIVAMAPFENGVGWIQYMRSGEMYTAAVELDGHVLFEIPGPVWYASSFENGAAFVVISDNATYYPNADPAIGCYEQVAPAVVHEEIYDLSGTILYSTAPEYAVNGEEDHILCAGDDMFVVLRHMAGLELNSWQLGAIGKYGERFYDFVEYSNVGKGLLQTWRGKYSGTRRLPNIYGAGYGNGNAGDQGDGFSRYIGEGVYPEDDLENCLLRPDPFFDFFYNWDVGERVSDYLRRGYCWQGIGSYTGLLCSAPICFCL